MERMVFLVSSSEDEQPIKKTGAKQAVCEESTMVSFPYSLTQGFDCEEKQQKEMESSPKATPVAVSVVKRPWTNEEDRLLIELVKQHGVQKWSHIAEKVSGRIGRQCRERWHNHLQPILETRDFLDSQDNADYHSFSDMDNVPVFLECPLLCNTSQEKASDPHLIGYHDDTESSGMNIHMYLLDMYLYSKLINRDPLPLSVSHAVEENFNVEACEGGPDAHWSSKKDMDAAIVLSEEQKY